MPFKPPSHSRARVRAAQKQRDQDRKSPRQRGYTTAWDKESRAFRRDHPLCAECKRRGKIRACDVVDHIKPVLYFPELTMDPSNWQSLCFRCNARKATADKKKYSHLLK